MLEKEVELVLDPACSDWFIEYAILAFQYFGGFAQAFRQVNQLSGFPGQSVGSRMFLTTLS